MSRKVRTHLAFGSAAAADLTPSRLTKPQFAKRLHNLMLSRGWTQSELARHAGMTRSNISTYMRGRSFPDPTNRDALARALNVEPEELLPNHVASAIDEDAPSFEIKSSVNAPGTAWLRVDRLVTIDTAMAVGKLIAQDNALDVAVAGE